jgi:tetratricopeptide (TPR) repeat protein
MTISKLKTFGAAALACVLGSGGARTLAYEFGGIRGTGELAGAAPDSQDRQTALPGPARVDDAKKSGTKAEVLQEALRTVSAEEKATSYVSVYVLIAIAKAQAKIGERVAASATLEYALLVAEALEPKRAAYALGAVAYAHWEVGDRQAIPEILRRAREAARRIDDTGERVRALGGVGEAQAWSGDSVAALETVGEMREIASAVTRENDRSFLLMHVVDLQASAGDFEGAFRNADLAPNDQARGAFLDRIASMAGSANHYFLQPPRELTTDQRAERLKLLHRILEASRNPSNKVVIAFGDLGETEEALRLARRRGEGKIPGNQGDLTAMPWVLTRIATAQAKFGHPDAAKKTFGEALDLIRPRPELKDRLEMVASGQAEAGDVEGALRTVDLIPIGNTVSKSRVLMEIAEIQSDRGDRANAAKTLRLALEDARLCLAHPPLGKPGTLGANPEYWRTESLRAIAQVQARLGDFNAALATAREMPQGPPWRGAAIGEIAKEQARSGKVTEVMAWVKRLDQPEDRVSALRGLAEGIAAGSTIRPGSK